MLKIVSRVLVIIINMVVGLMMVEIIKVVIKLKNQNGSIKLFFQVILFFSLKNCII